MHKTVLVLACLAFVAHGRRTETSSEQEQVNQLVDTTLSEQVNAKARMSPLKSLAFLLLAFEPSTAFSPSRPGALSASRPGVQPLAFTSGLGARALAPSRWYPHFKWPQSVGKHKVNGRGSQTVSMMLQPPDEVVNVISRQEDDAWLSRFQMLPDSTPAHGYVVDNAWLETPQLSLDTKAVPAGPEPFSFVRGDVAPLSEQLSDLVKTDNPVLKMAATQLFSKRQQGKGFRPTLVTLMALACAEETYEPMTPSDEAHRASETYKLQGKLAQITEMIHVASLIHDDILDEAGTRRGDLSVQQKFGNKVGVLAGDYLLATASLLLANLGDNRVVQIMALALKSLVEGELMQLQAAPEDYVEMPLYLRKSYYKTGSLITLSLRSAAILGGHDLDSDVTRAAEEYGYHLGLAYQIVDDVLDFTASTDVLGKPAGADMELGLATAPVLYAAEKDSSLRPLIMRRFEKKGDVKKAFDSVQSDGGLAIAKSRSLARWHAQRAVDAIYRLPPSNAREGLVRMAHVVLTRAK